MLARLKKWFSSVNNIKQADQAVVAVDALDIDLIFATEQAPGGPALMEGLEHYFLFGFAWAGSLVRMIFAWRLFHLQKNYGNRNETLKHAVIETLASVGIGTAVLGGFVGGVLFALAAPAIFISVLGMKSILHFIAAYRDHQQARKCVNAMMTADVDKRRRLEAKQKELLARSRQNLISGFGLAFVAIAVGLVMIAAKPVFAVFGVVGGLLGMFNAIERLIDERKKTQLTKTVSAAETCDDSRENATELRPLLSRASTPKQTLEIVIGSASSSSLDTPISLEDSLEDKFFEPAPRGSDVYKEREREAQQAALEKRMRKEVKAQVQQALEKQNAALKTSRPRVASQSVAMLMAALPAAGKTSRSKSVDSDENRKQSLEKSSTESETPVDRETRIRRQFIVGSLMRRPSTPPPPPAPQSEQPMLQTVTTRSSFSI